MEIYLRGGDVRVSELKEKFGNLHSYTVFNNIDETSFDNADVVFDLNLDDYPEEASKYNLINVLLVAGSLKCALLNICKSLNNKVTIVGLNTLPGFLNRDILEMSALEKESKESFNKLFPDVKTQWVKDRVGMVSARVLAMIINEACFTLEEGTANIEDIDKGMKLGTNYPFGPFEWADKIGVDQIFSLLSVLRKDTGDERFKICPLLKEKATLKESFYK